MKNLFMRLFKDEEGQGMVEYALIVFMISIAAILILPQVGDAVAAIFTTIEAALK